MSDPDAGKTLKKVQLLQLLNYYLLEKGVSWYKVLYT